MGVYKPVSTGLVSEQDATADASAHIPAAVGCAQEMQASTYPFISRPGNCVKYIVSGPAGELIPFLLLLLQVQHHSRKVPKLRHGSYNRPSRTD